MHTQLVKRKGWLYIFWLNDSQTVIMFWVKDCQQSSKALFTFCVHYKRDNLCWAPHSSTVLLEVLRYGLNSFPYIYFTFRGGGLLYSAKGGQFYIRLNTENYHLIFYLNWFYFNDFHFIFLYIVIVYFCLLLDSIK